MLIGVPKEIKNHEYRVALTPAGVTELVAHGHEVLVQSGAGLGSGIRIPTEEGRTGDLHALSGVEAQRVAGDGLSRDGRVRCRHGRRRHGRGGHGRRRHGRGGHGCGGCRRRCSR